VDTSVNDTLRIRAAGNYTDIAVTSGAATPKTTILADLNAAFLANNLPFIASIVGTNQIQIDTISPNTGPSAVLDIDTFANGSTLNTPLGLTDGATLTGLTVAALQVAVYPTTTTIDVSSATITALSTFANLTTTQQADLVAAIAEVIAPYFVETGYVLLSFVSGNLSEMRDAAFQPGGTYVGLPAGPAVAVVEDDGVTPFTYP
jgi:hypothetical protein